MVERVLATDETLKLIERLDFALLGHEAERQGWYTHKGFFEHKLKDPAVYDQGKEKTSKLLWLFPLRLVLDGVAGLRLLLTGQFVGTYTILRAHFNFYGSLGKWLKRRRECRKHITHRNEGGIYKRSIVWDYFVLRKKVFAKLKWEPKPLS